MTSPTLEPYKDAILQRLWQGQSKTEIREWLEKEKRVSIKRTQFYDFVKHLERETSPPAEEAPEPPPLRQVEKPEPVPMPEEDTLPAFVVEFPQAVHALSERLAALEHRVEEHQRETLHALRAFHEETLASLSRQRQEHPAQPTPQAQIVVAKPIAPPPAPVCADTLRQVWKRAFWITFFVWGVFELLVMRGYWRPLVAAIMRAV